MTRPETVVDYDAWKRGYTPPSEHVLIDQLAYRGARVIMASDWGEDRPAIWLVMRGKTPNRAIRNAIRKMLDLAMDDSEPGEPGEPYEYETPFC